jgi:hypothetical protein
MKRNRAESSGHNIGCRRERIFGSQQRRRAVQIRQVLSISWWAKWISSPDSRSGQEKFQRTFQNEISRFFSRTRRSECPRDRQRIGAPSLRSNDKRKPRRLWKLFFQIFHIGQLFPWNLIADLRNLPRPPKPEKVGYFDLEPSKITIVRFDSYFGNFTTVKKFGWAGFHCRGRQLAVSPYLLIFVVWNLYLVSTLI